MMFLWALALRPEWKASEFVFSSGIRDCLFQPHMRLKTRKEQELRPGALGVCHPIQFRVIMHFVAFDYVFFFSSEIEKKNELSVLRSYFVLFLMIAGLKQN